MTVFVHLAVPDYIFLYIIEVLFKVSFMAR